MKGDVRRLEHDREAFGLLLEDRTGRANGRCICLLLRDTLLFILACGKGE